MTAKKDVRDLSVAEVVKRTKKWAAKYYVPKKEITDPTKRALQQIADHIGAGFGCQKGHVRNVVTDILGLLPQFEGKAPVLPESLVVDSGCEIDIPVGVAVVPLDCRNSHDYPIKKPCLSHGRTVGIGSDAYRMNGTIGNNLDKHIPNLRPATEAEIKTLMASLAKARAKEAKKTRK